METTKVNIENSISVRLNANKDCTEVRKIIMRLKQFFLKESSQHWFRRCFIVFSADYALITPPHLEMKNNEVILKGLHLGGLCGSLDSIGVVDLSALQTSFGIFHFLKIVMAIIMSKIIKFLKIDVETFSRLSLR